MNSRIANSFCKMNELFFVSKGGNGQQKSVVQGKKEEYTIYYIAMLNDIKIKFGF